MSYQIIHKCENCGHEAEGQYQVRPPIGWYTIQVNTDASLWTCSVCDRCLPIKHKNGLVDLLGWLKHYLRR